MVKLIVTALAVLTFLTAISVVGAQTSTMTPTLTPAPTTTVPSSAPATGFGH